MSLQMVVDGPIARPVIFCDQCGEPIHRAEDGNFHWRHDEKSGLPTPDPVRFTHKKCCSAFDAANGFWWGVEDLDLLPVYLVRNLGQNWKKSIRKADFRSRLV